MRYIGITDKKECPDSGSSGWTMSPSAIFESLEDSSDLFLK
jgi:hypothetical protein